MFWIQSQNNFKPNLVKPAHPNSLNAIPAAHKVFLAIKRQLDASQDPTVLPSKPPNPPLPATHLVQNKKMKSIILEDYQDQFGTGQPITTVNLSTSKQHPFCPPSQVDLMRHCTTKQEKEEYYDAGMYCCKDVVVLVLRFFLGLRDF